jgi:hypothetical protein
MSERSPMSRAILSPDATATGDPVPPGGDVGFAVEAEGLRKEYGSRAGVVEAVRGVDLPIASGEVFGFLGPNGLRNVHHGG